MSVRVEMQPETQSHEFKVGSACIVCGSRLGKHRIAGLLQCESCDMTTADLSISHDELAQLYSSSYFNGAEYLDYEADEASLRSNFRHRLRFLEDKLGGLSGKSLFEIGAAYGFFLDLARPKFQRVQGIDISAEAAEVARSRFNLNVTSGDYLTVRHSQRFDVVAMWDTIEHLARPDLFLRKIHADLARDGVVVFSTGDIGSLFARARGSKWRMIHPPTHIHYFSRATASDLLNRGGFDIVDISHPGIWRNAKSILYYVFSLRLQAPRIFEALSRLPGTQLDLKVNFRDIMLVLARRR